MSVKYDFSGRRVLVTGGGRGLGLGIVKKFVESGASAVVVDYDANLLENVKKELTKNVETIQANLMDWEGTRSALKNVGIIHHLVNNAGIARPAETFMDIKPESIDQIFGLNLKAVVNVTQIIARGMIDNKIEGATVVNTSSISDVVAVKGLATYSSSKAALTMMTKCMAQELGEHGIRVNSIRPAMVRTEQVGTLAGNQSEVLQNVIKANSRKILNRLTEVSEVGDAVLFLSSSASGMTTGSFVVLDGGLTAC